MYSRSVAINNACSISFAKTGIVIGRSISDLKSTFRWTWAAGSRDWGCPGVWTWPPWLGDPRRGASGGRRTWRSAPGRPRSPGALSGCPASCAGSCCSTRAPETSAILLILSGLKDTFCKNDEISSAASLWRWALRIFSGNVICFAVQNPDLLSSRYLWASSRFLFRLRLYGRVSKFDACFRWNMYMVRRRQKRVWGKNSERDGCRSNAPNLIITKRSSCRRRSFRAANPTTKLAVPFRVITGNGNYGGN